MEKRYFIGVTLLLTVLSTNPILANRVNTNSPINLKQVNTLASQISSTLYKRGLDKDVAYELSNNFVEDEDYLNEKINNFLDIYQKISKEDLLEHLSTVALNRQKINFDSYDNLISIVSKINGSHPDIHDLKKLRTISNINKILC
ncbi:hypothetical protein MNB_SV-5-1585 [hydrothermal vent metagenome]|uniref:Uncharacterized protein n=1 Tax=hydrothermal vent metagenome TaxID=652676 RepID=A0A1W1EEY5_9ZZZZ